MNDALLSEEEGERKAFPAFGRGGSLKMRYALEEVVAVAVAKVVARRREAMRQFMVMIVRMMCCLLLIKNYESVVGAQRMCLRRC